MHVGSFLNFVIALTVCRKYTAFLIVKTYLFKTNLTDRSVIVVT